MITSEEIIKSIIKETGLIREEGGTPNFLSKPEMEYLLVYIVNVNRKLGVFEKEKKNVKSIVKETVEHLTSKKG